VINLSEKVNTIGKRYGRALIEVIENEKEYKIISNDLENFSTILKGNPNLRSGMYTLLFSDSQKTDFIQMISERTEMAEKSKKFLLYLAEKNRVKYLDDIIYMTGLLWLEKQNIEKIRVISSKKLNAVMIRNLKENLKKSIKKDIILENVVDTSLIAGIKLQRGGRFYDYSIKGNLKRLKDSITEEGG
jgi:F-type H+-transporting ATPase subunit delta